MTTDITELAQRNELLIANGQQTADLLTCSPLISTPRC